MENKQFGVLSEDELEGVSGGVSGSEERENNIFSTCSCFGRIFSKYNGIDIPSDQIECDVCGYKPSDPATWSNPQKYLEGMK